MSKKQDKPEAATEEVSDEVVDASQDEQIEAAAEEVSEEVVEAPQDEQAAEPAVAPEVLDWVLEGALMAAQEPLTTERLLSLFDEDAKPTKAEIKAGLGRIAEQCESRGIVLKQLASGHAFQVKTEVARYVSRLWQEKPPRYSRALLETLVLIAYKQPITRAEIEEIRGVAVSSHIVKTLLDREWIKVLGHKEVPGRPALFGTTKQFLDYFNLKSLNELPNLMEIIDVEEQAAKLDEEELAAAETVSETLSEDTVAANEEAEEAVDAELEASADAEAELEAALEAEVIEA